MLLEARAELRCGGTELCTAGPRQEKDLEPGACAWPHSMARKPAREVQEGKPNKANGFRVSGRKPFGLLWLYT